MCSVDGCEKPNRGLTGLCYAHYMRQWRYGTTDAQRKPAQRFAHTGGYQLIPAKNHPLANGNSHAYEHRVVYYDAHGEGPFPCHWCAATVTWGTLHIDHLDDDKSNNVTDNLVASCAVCNMSRGRVKMKITNRRKYGLEAFGRCLTAAEWGAEIGCTGACIKERINKMGWSIEKAVSTPSNQNKLKVGARPAWDSTDWRDHFKSI